MLVALAIALAGGIVAYALWRVPGWLGAAHAAAGLVVYAVVGYLWLMTLFIAPKLLELIVLALKRIHLAGGVLILYFAPPFLAALLTVRLLGRRRGRTAGIE